MAEDFCFAEFCFRRCLAEGRIAFVTKKGTKRVSSALARPDTEHFTKTLIRFGRMGIGPKTAFVTKIIP